MADAFGNIIVLVVNTLGHVLMLVLLLRFLLQATRADFYNPVSQSLVRLTAPVLNPLRRVIPSWRNFDFATLLVALLFGVLATLIMLLASKIDLTLSGIGIGTLLSWSFVGMLSYISKIYFWGLLISVIASWVAPFSGNPALMLVQQLLEPVQSLFRKVIPPIGGLDLSPIFIFLAIQLIDQFVIGGLRVGFGLGNQASLYVIGI